MPKLILHVGLHKTGTTAIQAFAAKNREGLRKQSLLYPEYPSVLFKKHGAHHEFAHAIAQQGKRLRFKQVRTLSSTWAKTASAGNLTVLLSSESISRHVDPKASDIWQDQRRAYLKKLKNVLSDFDITVLVVLRRQDDYFKSLFQEQVMRNAATGCQGFGTFLDKSEKNHLHKRFYDNLNVFEEVYRHIDILIYEDLIKDGDLCAGFFGHLGINTRDMIQVGIVRKSLSARETELKIFLNHAIRSEKQNREVLSWIRSPVGQGILDKYYGSLDFDLWENHQTRARFLARFEEENRKIHSRYLPQRQYPLFPPLHENTGPKLPQLPEQLKAELALKSLYLNSDRAFCPKYLQLKHIDRFLRWLRQKITQR